MGQMRFYAPSPDELLPHAVELAYIAGIEGVPWRSQNLWIDGILQISRTVTESGNLYIPWDVPGHGNRVLSTGTLMEREQPYRLTTELARGTLNRARSLATEMEANDLAIPDRVRVQLKTALDALVRAATFSDGSDDDAAIAIRNASDAIKTLSQQSVRLTLDERHARDGATLPTILAGTLSGPFVPEDAADSFLDAFHATAIPFRWRDLQPTDGQTDWSLVEKQLEWCREHRLRIIGGPLIQLDPLHLPDWITKWENDYDSFEQHALGLAQQVVERFDDQVDIWVCAGRLNVRGSLPYSEEQKLRLAVATIETVRHAVSTTPVVISFDQPWAEYLSTEDYDLSPLHFADALVRADIGVAGVGLELNLGCWPGATLPRDLLEISRHIDRWSLLGIPLIVFLTVPDHAGTDPHVTGASEVVTGEQDEPDKAAVDHSLVEQLILLLLSKPSLHAIVWNQLGDSEPHEFPYTGLFDAQGRPKPVLHTFSSIRRQHLA